MRTSAEIARALFEAAARGIVHIWSFNDKARMERRQQLQAVSDRYHAIVATIEGDLAADRLLEAMDKLEELRAVREEYNTLCSEHERLSPVVAIQLAGRISVQLRRTSGSLIASRPQRSAA